jgi:hypothetical protein
LPSSPPARAATSPAKPQEPPAAVGAPAGAPVEAPKRALSFDVPECPELKLLGTEGAVATVQIGDSEPEQVRVGDLLESGEVTFVGRHPESRAPIMLLENAAKVPCRAQGLRTLAALTQIGPSSAQDFARRAHAPAGDPKRVETMVLKLPPGAKRSPAEFRAAELKR